MLATPYLMQVSADLVDKYFQALPDGQREPTFQPAHPRAKL